MAELQAAASARHYLRPRRPASIGFPQNRRIVDSIAHPAPPAVTVEHISDPTAAGQGIELVALDAVQLPSQPLRARRVIVRLDSATVVLHEVSTRLRTRTRVQEGLIAYVSFGAHSRGTVGGITAGPGMLLAAAPQAEARFVVEPGWESITYLLPSNTMRAQLDARQRSDRWYRPPGLELLQADPALVRELHAWGRRLVHAALAEPGRFDRSAQRRFAAQVELVDLLLAALRTRADGEPCRKQLTRQQQSRILKIAEDRALALAGERPNVSDLCRTAAVSERTLEVAFKQTVGLTPVAYLTRLRLHRVRDALQSEDRTGRTVSSIALDWGFWHFGEFSRAYRECFGELPSQTLRRGRSPN
jgi:AraC family ethanolamine operon transcriptional activator